MPSFFLGIWMTPFNNSDAVNPYAILIGQKFHNDEGGWPDSKTGESNGVWKLKVKFQGRTNVKQHDSQTILTYLKELTL